MSDLCGVYTKEDHALVFPDTDAGRAAFAGLVLLPEKLAEGLLDSMVKVAATTGTTGSRSPHLSMQLRPNIGFISLYPQRTPSMLYDFREDLQTANWGTQARYRLMKAARTAEEVEQ